MLVVNVSGVSVNTDQAEEIGRVGGRRVLLCRVCGRLYDKALVLEPEDGSGSWELVKIFYYAPYTFRDFRFLYSSSVREYADAHSDPRLLVCLAEDFNKERGLALFCEDTKGDLDFLAAWFHEDAEAPTMYHSCIYLTRDLMRKVYSVGKRLNWKAVRDLYSEILNTGSVRLLRK